MVLSPGLIDVDRRTPNLAQRGLSCRPREGGGHHHSRSLLATTTASLIPPTLWSRRAKLALSYASHFSGVETSEARSGVAHREHCERCVGWGAVSCLASYPTRRFAPPSPRRRGRDEDRRCGCTVCNDSVRPTKFAPSLRAQAKQSIARNNKSDCFVAFAPRNDVTHNSHIPAPFEESRRAKLALSYPSHFCGEGGTS